MSAKLLKLFLSGDMSVGLYNFTVRGVMRGLSGKFSYYEPRDLKIHITVTGVLSILYILFLMYKKNYNIYVVIIAAIALFVYWLIILERHSINRKFFKIYNKIRFIFTSRCFHEMIYRSANGGLTDDDFLLLADKSLIDKYVKLIKYERENPGYRFKETQEHNYLRNDLNTAYNYLIDIIPDSRNHKDGWGQYESRALEAYQAMCHH